MKKYIRLFMIASVMIIAMTSVAKAATVIVQRYGPPPHRVAVRPAYPEPCAREKIVRYEHGREVVVYKNRCRVPYADKVVIYR